MKLIPQPQQIAPLPGQYRITYRDRITLDAGCSPAAYTYAKLLAVSWRSLPASAC